MMTIVFNIWRICLKFNWFVYDPNWMLQLSEFVWTLRSSVWVVFNNFLLIDATDKSKISRNRKCFFFAVSLYPLSFFANTSFKLNKTLIKIGSSCTCFQLVRFLHIFSFGVKIRHNVRLANVYYINVIIHLPCCMYLKFGRR